MKKLFLLLPLFFGWLIPLSAQPLKTNKSKLVVGIVVDQMRYDYLTKYWDKFTTEGGFKRLVNNGVNCSNGHFNYAPTFTGPGHTSVYTGSTPRFHGIIANNWYDKKTKSMVYCVGDDAVSPVGTQLKKGKGSPHRLLGSTITDELKLAYNLRSKVIALSLKDRSAILPGGHMPDGAYWFAGKKDGRFVTSSYYKEALPEWVENFNDQKHPKAYFKQSWNTLLPIEQYAESLADNNPYERPLGDKEKPVFPYDLKALSKKELNYDLLMSTPFGNSIVTDFAIQAIEHEELGKDDIPDLLAISYSSTDIIGHVFGPHSIEVEDAYLRLDLEIEKLLKYLDEKVGTQNYMVFLTADHAGANIPAYTQTLGFPAKYIEPHEYKEPLDSLLSTYFGEGNWIEHISNNQVFLNMSLIREQKLLRELDDMEELVVDFLLQQSGIDKALTSSSLQRSEFAIGYRALLQAGFHQNRSGNVLFIMDPGSMQYGIHGTTHGSVYNYDTHVPILFFGAGIPTKRILRKVEITDIAVTVAQYLDIQMPDIATGTPVYEIWK